MKNSVLTSEQFEFEVFSALTSLATRASALKLEDDINQVIENLKDSSDLYPVVLKHEKGGTVYSFRRVIFSRYIIFYVTFSGQVILLRLFHQRSNYFPSMLETAASLEI
jgi:plasmid stabilization system protein ParE